MRDQYPQYIKNAYGSMMKRQKFNYKLAKDLNRHFPKDKQMAYKDTKMFNVTGHYRNANQNKTIRCHLTPTRTSRLEKSGAERS